MRGGVGMIDLSKYLIFENNKKTFKETSKDDHDGSITYMTESQYQVISFDDVKEEYIKDLGLKSVPRSNDALLSLPDGSLVFVEFKNGYIDSKDQHDIRKKIFDSMLIFSDIVETGISHTRAEMDYILVYNQAKNPLEASSTKTKVSDSESRDAIAKKLSSLGHTEYVKFGLDIFKNYCFREVYSYTIQEFEKNFLAKHAI